MMWVGFGGLGAPTRPPCRTWDDPLVGTPDEGRKQRQDHLHPTPLSKANPDPRGRVRSKPHYLGLRVP